ncbi:hypothetical protein IFM89_037623 [Coptis chinensis]|uniref:Uncharacterized protein n=1 Tax=Coptis chinensis TaxID=261450 RepID=A0A835J2B2_9MAGN|nr:hypothetical protein IFM89_037623 [Coptis chinensis]
MLHSLDEYSSSTFFLSRLLVLRLLKISRELYRLVLVDTTLAPYFSECITSEGLDDMNIEIMRNTLYKAYLEDFYRFCRKRQCAFCFSALALHPTRDDRRKLYSSFGLCKVAPQAYFCFHPYGHEELAVCEDIDQVSSL